VHTTLTGNGLADVDVRERSLVQAQSDGVHVVERDGLIGGEGQIVHVVLTQVLKGELD